MVANRWVEQAPHSAQQERACLDIVESANLQFRQSREHVVPVKLWVVQDAREAAEQAADAAERAAKAPPPPPPEAVNP